MYANGLKVLIVLLAIITYNNHEITFMGQRRPGLENTIIKAYSRKLSDIALELDILYMFLLIL